jgi:hypothetical protein
MHVVRRVADDHRNRRFALAFDPLRVLLRHEPKKMLAAFREVEGIDEAQPFERLIGSG